MWNCGYGMMGGWGWLGALFSLLILALIIGVILIVHRLTTNSSTPVSSMSASSAEAILAERYARGEIDDQEYQQRLAILRAN